MKIGYFDTKEFASKDGAESPWPCIVDHTLIELCNKIREELGCAIIVTSGYRSPAHNEAVGGAKSSYHVQGKAADLQPYPFRYKKVSELHEICDRLNPNGGVGFYDRFAHVDVRGWRARWDERKKK